jgi:hypothetical protein
MNGAPAVTRETNAPGRAARRETTTPRNRSATAAVIVAMVVSTSLGVDQSEHSKSRPVALAVEPGYEGTPHNHNQVVL